MGKRLEAAGKIKLFVYGDTKVSTILLPLFFWTIFVPITHSDHLVYSKISSSIDDKT
jgi:hypothetical protein